MLRRKITEKLIQWKESKYGLLIDGARQIGKTYIIREFIKENFEHFIELNLIENRNAVNVLSQSINTDDFILRLSSIVDTPLVENKTVIFIDEIQEFSDFDIVTMSKFLVNDGKFRFVFSGSLLGVEQYGINSWPEGYMMLEKMYPLDFEEFLWANDVNQDIIDVLYKCYQDKSEVPNYIHDKFINLFRYYLLVGGMPEAVNAFVETNDFNKVSLAHKVIEQYYEKDVSKYASSQEKILIKEMYDLLPSELKSQSKRFNLSDIPGNKRNDNMGLSFGWFTKAGIAIPTYNVNSPNVPLELSSNHRLVKLFHADVGILTYLLMDSEIKMGILQDGRDVEFGAIYENAVAQMLTASGYEKLYYYNKKGIGEIDFLVQKQGKVIPIEVKSGKDYKRHSALDKFITEKPYNKDIDNAIVLSNNNVSIQNKTTYLPIYMAMFI